MQVLAREAEVALPLLGAAAPEVLELGALALEGAEVLVAARGGRLPARSSAVSMSASSLAGRDVDLVAPACCGRAVFGRVSGIQVVHQFVHQAGHEPDRADRLGIAPSASARGRRRRRSPGPGGRTGRGRATRRASRSGAFSWPMKTWIRPELGDVADELAEVGPVLEGREHAPELVALGELGRLHDVEQAVAEDLLDRRGVVLAQDRATTRSPTRRASASSGSPSLEPRRATRSASVAVMLDEPVVEERGDAVERRLVDGSSSSSVTRACLMAPSRRTRIRLAIRSLIGDEVDPADVRRRAAWPASPGRRRG